MLTSRLRYSLSTVQWPTGTTFNVLVASRPMIIQPTSTYCIPLQHPVGILILLRTPCGNDEINYPDQLNCVQPVPERRSPNIQQTTLGGTSGNDIVFIHRVCLVLAVGLRHRLNRVCSPGTILGVLAALLSHILIPVHQSITVVCDPFCIHTTAEFNIY